MKLKGSSSSEGEREEEEGERRREEGAIPYVLAVFSARELVYENVSTSPGFLPESLMLLAEKTGRVTEVGSCVCACQKGFATSNHFSTDSTGEGAQYYTSCQCEMLV